MDYIIDNTRSYIIDNPFNNTQPVILHTKDNNYDKLATIKPIDGNPAKLLIPAGLKADNYAALFFASTKEYTVDLQQANQQSVTITVQINNVATLVSEDDCGCSGKTKTVIPGITTGGCGCEDNEQRFVIIENRLDEVEKIDWQPEICRVEDDIKALKLNYANKIREYAALSKQIRGLQNDDLLMKSRLTTLENLTKGLEQDEENIKILMERTAKLPQLLIDWDKLLLDVKSLRDAEAQNSLDIINLKSKVNIDFPREHQRLEDLINAIETRVNGTLKNIRDEINLYSEKLTEFMLKVQPLLNWFDINKDDLDSLIAWWKLFKMSYAARQAEIDKKFELLTNSVNDLNIRVNEALTKLQELINKVDKYDCDINTFLETFNKIQNAYKAILERMGKIEKILEDLDLRVCDLSKRVSKLEKDEKEFLEFYGEIIAPWYGTLSATQKENLKTNLHKLVN